NPVLLDGTHSFMPAAVSDLPQDYWTLGGTWQVSGENITSQSANAELNFRVGAKDVYVVAGSADGQSHRVSVGLPSVNATEYGSDAPDGVLTVNGSKLYHIVSLKQPGSTLVTLIVPKGVTLYTFTFGS
ncbi:MAG TPA: hypothetical protein VNG90_03570, partial [Candidatus Acidoferrum sp.]|nr:hypothetical protein [Candidatus Acidoferrum sp.]